MENVHANRELTCVLFPGVVKNEERAIQCLGGLKSISAVHSNLNKKRLGLNYQPENPFVKRIFADIKRSSGVLFKVKVKKKKVDDKIEREVVSTTILGRVKKCYRFESMGDFQYMPADRFGDGPLQCILDQILPSGLNEVSFMTEPSPAPLFIVPTNFTRSDRPVRYCYTEKRYVAGKRGNELEGGYHIRLRTDRGNPIAKFTFNLIDDMPNKPNEYFIKAAKLDTSRNMKEMYLKLKEMFEERPIWSQNLIRYHTKYRIVDLKVLMPCLAIRMEHGPWHMLWVRYGYDPRKEPASRKYQILDFRLRHQAGIYSMVLSRDQVANYKKADRVKYNQRRSLDDLTFKPGVEKDEGAVYFRPGMVPTQRQIFYMYCDVKIPEVEEILAPEPPPGYLCHQKRGWLPNNTAEMCRDHIFRYVKETLLASHNSDMRLEQGVSFSDDDGSNSEEVDDESSSEEPSTSKT